MASKSPALRSAGRSARAPPAHAASRPTLRRRLVEAITVDAPAWNAVWAAVVVVPVATWVLGAWLLPALDIRPTSSLTFLPELPPDALQPEPLEQQRYLLTVIAALAIVPCALLVARRRSLDRVTRLAPPVALVAIVAIAAVCLARDHGVADHYYSMGPVLGVVVAVVLAFCVLTLFAGRCRWLVLTVDRVSRRRGVEVIVFLAALLLAAGVTSVGLYADRTIALATGQTLGHLGFTFEEATAVAYGRTPLVDFTPQYSVLISWLLAPLFLLKSPTVALFTGSMAAIGTFSLACLYLTFRLTTGTAARAALLFLPACAIGFVRVDIRSGWNIHSIADYFAAMPLRDAGPLVLALVCVWVVAAERSRARALGLGAMAGVVILLNVEFGLAAAAAATIAALVLNADARPLVRRTAALLGEMLIGLVTVFVVFTLMTLVRSGSLPEPSQLVYFQRQFAVAGFFMLPMDHLLALHVLVFATFAAAAVAGLGLVAFDRVRPGIHGRRSVALLIYSGVFGFGVFQYYMGRTHPAVLSATFLAWGVALMALSWEAGCRLAGGGVSARAVRPIAALFLVATAVLSVDAVRHLDYVVHQPFRIASNARGFPAYTEPDAVNALRRCVPRGTNVLIITPVPDRVAHLAHVHNWYAYEHPGSPVTFEQLDRIFALADRHRVTAAVTQGDTPPQLMLDRGFDPVRYFPTKEPAEFQRGATYIWSLNAPAGTIDCHGAGRRVTVVGG